MSNWMNFTLIWYSRTWINTTDPAVFGNIKTNWFVVLETLRSKVEIGNVFVLRFCPTSVGVKKLAHLCKQYIINCAKCLAVFALEI